MPSPSLRPLALSTLMLLLFAIAVAVTAPAMAQGDATGKLRAPLAEVLEQSAPDALVPISVVLHEQVTSADKSRVRAGLARREARPAVLALLRETARASQGPLLTRLRALNAEGRVERIRPLWIGNVVGVDATPAIVREIAARPEVAWINYNPKVDVFLKPPREVEETGVGGAAPDATGNDALECGVDLMNADRVWNELGLTGEGAVVAVIDSGVCWTHPDIVNQVWVNPGEDRDGDGAVMDADDQNGVDDDGNGFVDDLVGWNFEFGTNTPNDDNSHGSHCAGTVAGDGTGGTQTGMAPDAKVMILRIGLTFADEVDVWNAMQYAADNGADAISMSLGWPHNQNPDRATWRTNAENTIDAGTAMVVAAGNEGQGAEPDNVRTPGDVPRVITVGAVDCSDFAASFSSRGPVTWEDVPAFGDHAYPPGLVKPDIAGPGVDTISSNVCSGYSTKSGTSMATPHVAGAVALMVSGNPGLEHDEIKQVLMDTAVDLGEPGMDNTFGRGRVDIFAAVDRVFGLSLENIDVIDSDPAYANGDGGIDTGEIVTLALTLENNWSDRPATDIEAFVTTSTPGVSLVHDYVTWPDAAPGAMTTSVAPHLSLRIDAGCNVPVELVLHMRYSGRDARIVTSVLVGTNFPRTLLEDDFESNQSWSSGGTSAKGVFVRDDPRGMTNASGGVIQPENDATPDPGRFAFVTGNGDTTAGSDDVDSGTAELTSPTLDATNFSELRIDYQRHFYALPSTTPPTDFFRAEWSRDGASWNLIEELSTTVDEWTPVSATLPPSAFGPGLRVRFVVDDQPIVQLESVVEGLVDDVALSGQRVECDAFTPPVANAPNSVGNTLVVVKQGEDVRFEWQAPPVDASHGAATLYRVYSSPQPASGFAIDGLATQTFHVDADAAQGGTTAFFLIVAENGGGTSEVPE